MNTCRHVLVPTIALMFTIAFVLSGSVAFGLDVVDVSVSLENITGYNELSTGFMLDHDWESWRDSYAQINLAQEADFRLVRLFDWRDNGLGPCTYWNETTKTGRFDWSEVDSVVRRIFEIGAEPLFCLGASRAEGPAVPRGMRVNPQTRLPFAESFASYAAQWIIHFKNSGFPVRYYEIWNEPFTYFGWSVNSERLSYFVNFWNVCARAMRAADSEVRISNDFVTNREMLNYWIRNGDDIDFLDFHKYDCSEIGECGDQELFYRAEQLRFESDYTHYGVDRAREIWFGSRGKVLPVIMSEGNLNSAWEDGTDPRIQRMIGAIWTGLVLRKSVLKGLSYSVYYCFSSSGRWISSSGGTGFGMVNSYTRKPWYPYYVNSIFGNNLAVGDPILETQSSSQDIRTLAWMHNGEPYLLLICKVDTPKVVRLSGMIGELNISKIDNSIPYDQASLQTETIDADQPLTMNGYTVALIRASVGTPTNRSSAFIFRNGFESGNLSSWTGATVSSGATIRITEQASYQGSFGATFTLEGSGVTASAYCYQEIDEEEVYARGYFSVASNLPLKENDDRFYFMRFMAGGNLLAGVGVRRQDNNEKWALYGNNGSDLVGSFYATSPSVEISQWYCIELHWKKDATHGVVEAFIDDKRTLWIENLDTSRLGNVSTICFGLVPAIGIQENLTVFGDCFAVSHVYIGTLYDLDHDGSTHISDIAIVASSLGAVWSAENPSPRWKPEADLNDDLIVNIMDIVIIASAYKS